MKIGPNRNFPVRVYAEADKFGGYERTQRFLEGVYSLTLNHRVKVILLPELDPADLRDLAHTQTLDKLTTASEVRARLVEGRYVVVPDDDRAGVDLTLASVADRPTVVLYVGSDEFLTGRFLNSPYVVEPILGKPSP